jgi:hypothetical protein
MKRSNMRSHRLATSDLCRRSPPPQSAAAITANYHQRIAAERRADTYKAVLDSSAG